MAKLFGLRVRIAGRAPISMALDQAHYLVSAGASWRRLKTERRASATFDGTGLDDRLDHLTWFAAAAPVGARIDVAVRDLKAGRPCPSVAAERPSTCGFLVTLNGRHLARVGVADPGTLSVTVYARRDGNQYGAHLHLHGGDALNDGWRWRTWEPSSVELRVGDRVRITRVAPTRLERGAIRGIEPTLPTDAVDIRGWLKDLRRQVSARGQRATLARLTAEERARPEPRSYSRALSSSRSRRRS
jgi:hypothetical protein